ncbi:hypothetical protein VI817_000005 [Penicillium citrinum]|nr:hypothetical protein VI817_000005 [Penicillium citrinum]
MMRSQINFYADQYSSKDMTDALGAGEDHAMEGSTIRSREDNRYPYRFLNKDKDGNDEVSLPSDSLCAQPGAAKYEWPILRNGNIFGTRGNKRAENDRVIFASYDPPGDSQKVWAFCALITHEGANRPGGLH